MSSPWAAISEALTGDLLGALSRACGGQEASGALRVGAAAGVVQRRCCGRQGILTVERSGLRSE